MADTENSFEIAAQSAIESFRKQYEGMTPEQKAGAKIVIVWLKAWFMKAGYKWLCRKLLQEFA